MARAVGIDFGAEALRGVVLETGSGGKINLISAGVVPLGDLKDLADNQDKRLAIAEKLKDLVYQARLKGGIRRAVLPNKNTDIRYLMVPPVPPWRLEMLVKYEVEEKQDDARAKAFDYRILDIPDSTGQYTVLIGAADERDVEWILDAGAKAHLGELETDIETTALFNAYLYGHGYDPEKTVWVVDIGSDHVHAILIKDGVLYYAESFSGGGKAFTKAIADGLGISEDEAEEHKKRAGEIRFDLIPQRNTMVTGSRMRQTMLRARSGFTSRPNRSQAPGEMGSGEGDKEQPPSSSNLQDGIPAVPSDREGYRGAVQTPPASDPLQIDLAGGNTAASTEPKANEQESPERQRSLKVSTSLIREAAALTANLENALNTCRQQHKLREIKVDKVYLCGGGAKVRGLSEYIARRMQAEVGWLEPFRGISLEKLPASLQEAIREEEGQLAVSLGVALSGLKSNFRYLLWPEALREEKEFRSRGAYLYYAAALVLGAIVFLWLTFTMKYEVLADTKQTASTYIDEAQKADKTLLGRSEAYQEHALRLQQLEENAFSGHFFLNVLAELKTKRRCPDFVYLTSISTQLPQIVLVADEQARETAVEVDPLAASAALAKQIRARDADPNNSFQAQSKVYLRGFVRQTTKEGLIDLIYGDIKADGSVPKPGFMNLLVPYPDEPSHPDNLFSDIRLLWRDPQDQQIGKFYLKEFVLEAYIEGTRDSGKAAEKAASKKKQPEATKEKQETPPKPSSQPAESKPEPEREPPPAAGEREKGQTQDKLGLEENPSGFIAPSGL